MRATLAAACLAWLSVLPPRATADPGHSTPPKRLTRPPSPPPAAPSSPPSPAPDPVVTEVTLRRRRGDPVSLFRSALAPTPNPAALLCTAGPATLLCFAPRRAGHCCGKRRSPASRPSAGPTARRTLQQAAAVGAPVPVAGRTARHILQQASNDLH